MWASGGCRTSEIRDATETSLVKPPPNDNHRYANRPRAKMSLSVAVKTHIALRKKERKKERKETLCH